MTVKKFLPRAHVKRLVEAGVLTLTEANHEHFNPDNYFVEIRQLYAYNYAEFFIGRKTPFIPNTFEGRYSQVLAIESETQLVEFASARKEFKYEGYEYYN